MLRKRKLKAWELEEGVIYRGYDNGNKTERLFKIENGKLSNSYIQADGKLPTHFSSVCSYLPENAEFTRYKAVEKKPQELGSTVRIQDFRPNTVYRYTGWGDTQYYRLVKNNLVACNEVGLNHQETKGDFAIDRQFIVHEIFAAAKDKAA